MNANEEAWQHLRTRARSSYELTVEWNPHRGGHESIPDYLESRACEPPPGCEDWETLVLVQCYPNNAVGFGMGWGENLRAALDQLECELSR